MLSFNKRIRRSLSFLLLLFIAASAQDPTVVLTDPVELAPGTFITGENKGAYDQFLGVPFAEPPLGSLRFRVKMIIFKSFN